MERRTKIVCDSNVDVMRVIGRTDTYWLDIDKKAYSVRSVS